MQAVTQLMKVDWMNFNWSYLYWFSKFAYESNNHSERKTTSSLWKVQAPRASLSSKHLWCLSINWGCLSLLVGLQVTQVRAIALLIVYVWTETVSFSDLVAVLLLESWDQQCKSYACLCSTEPQWVQWDGFAIKVHGELQPNQWKQLSWPHHFI